MIIEACVEAFEEAVNAEKLGATQIELCSELQHGGLTPDIELVRKVLDHLTIPVKVMIRPRPGDFVYLDKELLLMLESIELMKKERISGLVLGILYESGRVNVEQTTRLIETAGELPVTFHRAVDSTPDPVMSVHDIKKTGAFSILTSGAAETALQGCQTIRQMVSAAGTDLLIMAAGGIIKDNLSIIQAQTNAHAFHGSRIVGHLK